MDFKCPNLNCKQNMSSIVQCLSSKKKTNAANKMEIEPVPFNLDADNETPDMPTSHIDHVFSRESPRKEQASTIRNIWSALKLVSQGQSKGKFVFDSDEEDYSDKENVLPPCTHQITHEDISKCMSPGCAQVSVDNSTPMRKDMIPLYRLSTTPLSSCGVGEIVVRSPLGELQVPRHSSRRRRRTSGKHEDPLSDEVNTHSNTPQLDKSNTDERTEQPCSSEKVLTSKDKQYTKSKSLSAVPRRMADSDSDSDAMENFFLRQRPAQKVKEDLQTKEDSLGDFIVDDNDLTSEDESSDEEKVCANSPSFYRQIEVSRTKSPLLTSIRLNSERPQDKNRKWESSEESSDDDIEEFGRSHDVIEEENESESDSNKSDESSDDSWVAQPRKLSPKRPLPSGPRIDREAGLSFLASLSSNCDPTKRDATAVRYIKSFKANKVELVTRLFKFYNEKIFDNLFSVDLEISWNKRLTQTAGQCKYWQRRSQGNAPPERSAKIQLSDKVCDTAERVRDTLVHELCHAAVWLKDGVNDGHGPRWKYWADHAMRQCPEVPPIGRCHAYAISTRFTYRCVQCGSTVNRHSKSLNTDRKVCGRCKGKFELLVNTPAGRKRASQVTRRPNQFAEFVKEHYGVLRSGKGAQSHKDTMALLGQRFKEMKMSAGDSGSPELDNDLAKKLET